VERAAKPVALAVSLPVRWWWTDLRFRQSSVEPRTYFEDRPLTDTEKQKLGLKPDGFASEVRYVADFSRVMKSHELKTGDIIFAVDGVERDDVANSVNLFITLRKTAGDDVMLNVIRGGQRMKMPLKTYRMSFRK
jgi:S1-C subfamily serine protease